MHPYIKEKTILDKIPYSKMITLTTNLKKLDLGQTEWDNIHNHREINDMLWISEIKHYCKYYPGSDLLVVENFRLPETIPWFDNHIVSPISILFRACDFKYLKFFRGFENTKIFTFQNCLITGLFMYRFMPWVNHLNFIECQFPDDFDIWFSRLDKNITMPNIYIGKCMFDSKKITLKIAQNGNGYFIVNN